MRANLHCTMMDVDAQIGHKPCDADWNAVQREAMLDREIGSNPVLKRIG